MKLYTMLYIRPQNILITLLTLSLWFSVPQVHAQSGSCSSPTYNFDFHGANANCSFTCGKVINESIWKVSGDTCVNTRDTIWLNQLDCGSSGNTTEVNIRLDREGNQVTADDFVVTDIFCSGDLMVTDTTWGDWVPDQGMSNVRTNTYYVNCSHPSFMIIEVTIGSHAQNAQLKQLSSGSCINCLGGSLLPINFTNEKLSQAAREVRYSFDMEPIGDEHDKLPASIVMEHSVDGVDFSPVSNFEVSKQGKHIQLTDVAPNMSHRYYRARVKMEGAAEKNYSAVLHWKPTGEEISIFPNPSRADQPIHVKAASPIRQLIVRDVTGRTLQLIQPANTSNTINLNTSTLPGGGIYFITIMAGNEHYSLPLVVN